MHRLTLGTRGRNDVNFTPGPEPEPNAIGRKGTAGEARSSVLHDLASRRSTAAALHDHNRVVAANLGHGDVARLPPGVGVGGEELVGRGLVPGKVGQGCLPDPHADGLRPRHTKGPYARDVGPGGTLGWRGVDSGNSHTSQGRHTLDRRAKVYVHVGVMLWR
jgi:hypothetical protein